MAEDLENMVADLVSLPDAARMLSVDKETARRWAVNGEFPGDAARKLGRRWVVSARKLRTYLHGEAA